MGSTKLCLLLLLGTYTLAQQDVAEQSPVCNLAKRFKNFRRFVYDYEAETFNGVTGATDNKSGSKISCRVEVDVPQTCSFILRTTECSLSEIADLDDGENVVYRPAAGTEAFRDAMAMNSLKITFEGQTIVELFPEDNEPVNILNIKRGIVSALLVPALEEEQNKEMATVHGVCATDYVVNFRDDIATDVTVMRNLAKCDWFNARRQTTSPLALISGMNYPLSKMIASSQACNYQFDNQKKHMTSGTCIEKHLFLPLSYKNEYGISAMVKQTLNLRETTKINDRVFDINQDNLKSLHMDVTDVKSPVQTKEAAMATMSQLTTLTEGEERATLFRQLVSQFRGLEAEVLGTAAVEMLDMSFPLTFQALLQCGTPECTSAILKGLRTFDESALEVDATVYALGLVSNPSRLMVKDMLAMAQYKNSKPIMYALSNAVRRLHHNEGVTPEITAVSEFVSSILDSDCPGEKDLTFLTLRVVGNMGAAMEEADAAIKGTLLKCMRQPATTLSVQLAAIQAFRRMSVTPEVRSNLQRVSQYPKGAVQKRLAAYLILMRDPQDSDIEMVKKLIKQEQNVQIKSFVTSHAYNIINSADPETQEIGKKIVQALEDNEVVTHNDFTTMSRNYKFDMTQEDVMKAGIQGNMVFDPSSQLPREVLLETTLNVFGFNMDVWEFGMEGKGFEPTIEALFGKNGFFPDTLMKAIYSAADVVPPSIKKLMEYAVNLDEAKVPENLVREVVNNFNKLIKDLQSQDSTEAMAFLRIMGAELGYIKASDLKYIMENAQMYTEILLMGLPSRILPKIMSGTNNEIFAHYIFMDNNFMLPTAAGLPLTFAMTGTFTPGAKGGLSLAPKTKELLFKPSVGVEFMTQMGVHVPTFVVSAVEMQTTMYHESTVNARISMERNQVKLSMPAPQDTTKLFSIRNKVMIVGADQATMIPHTEGESNCGPLFPGLKYCTKTLRAVPADHMASPAFPLNGETMFSVDIKPTNEISEYTVTIAYDLLSEGKDGRHQVDTLTTTLRAEGAEPIEAITTMKYNRNRNVFTTQVQVPDMDIEAGIKLSMTDSSSKGKAMIFELNNKNVPQMSLIGRVKAQAMNDAMMQLQLLVPSLKTDAAITATMSNTDRLTLEIKSDVKLPETTSVQAIVFKYGEDQAEIKLSSNMNADTTILVPYTEALQAWLRQFVEDVMDQQVVKTDMKLRHIVNKAFEASNIWMDKISTDIPYVETMRNQIAAIEMPNIPENLFIDMESTLKYQFNQEQMIITIPVPFGGQSSEELRIPEMLTSPHINLPQMGVNIAPREIQIPTFTIPLEYDLVMPLMGMLEASTKINSNLYKCEATVSAGNNTVDLPSYLVEFNIVSEGPIELLSLSTYGLAKVNDTEEKTMQLTFDGNMKHVLGNAGFRVRETIDMTDSLRTTGLFHVYAQTQVGLQTSLTANTQTSLDVNMFSGSINGEGNAFVGSYGGSTNFANSFSVEPMKREAKMESTLRMDTAIVTFVNKVEASFANEELLLESNTNMNSGPIKHNTKMSLSYKDVKLTIQYDAMTKADEKMLRSQMEFSSVEGQATLRIENQADDTENRAYSLITGSLNPSGLEVNTDASMNIFSNLASHKATLTVNTNGLTTSCTTTAQYSPMTFENVFHGGVDASGATISLTTKGAMKDNKAELTAEGKLASTEAYFNSVFKGNLFDINTRNRMNLRVNEDGLIASSNMVGSLNEMRTENTHTLSLALRSFTLRSKTDNVLNNKNSYMHDITVNMEPYIASVVVKNDLKIMEIGFVNDAQFKAEPYNMEVTGTMMGVFAEEELKHTYEIKFVDMVFSTMCNTNGKFLGSHVTHTTDMEVAGLNMKFNDVANINSPSLRLDSKLKTMAAPFTLTIDGLLSLDASISLFGEHSGDLSSKFLLKAEPLLFTHSLEQRASTTHEMEGIPAVNTVMENKFSSMLSLDEQRVTLLVKSKVNEHAFSEEISAYNNAEIMGIDMAGVVSTSYGNVDAIATPQDYSISGFVKYDKNSDSHLIQFPFLEYLPAFIANVKTTMMKLMDNSIDMLKEINNKLEISAKLQDKVAELKEVIETFDFNLFVEDFRKYVSSVENVLTNLMTKIPTEKIMNALKSLKEAVMALIEKYDIANKFNVVYAKVEEILSKYEVEKIVEAVMDEIVKIMKQYQLREKVQSAFVAIKSIDFQPMLEKALAPVKELVKEILSIDFKQLIEDATGYFMNIVQKMKSFDYDTFLVELKEKVPDMAKVPCFGKLYGEFKVASPDFNVLTTAHLENTTTESVTPEFKVKFNSMATTTGKHFDFDVDANVHVSLPERSRLSITENVNFGQSLFSLDHKGSMTLNGLSAQASADTKANVASASYTADFVNNVNFATENGVAATAETSIKQNINMPRLNIFADSQINQKTNFQFEDGTARLTFNNLANGKLSVQDFLDEGSHKSDIEVVMDLHTAKITFTGETGSNRYKINQNAVADICIFRHLMFDAKTETDTPFMKGSIAEVKFQAKIEDMKIDFSASHTAELEGRIEGPISNTAVAMITPTELLFDTKNKGNAKVALPFLLSGKVDLQNDIALTLNSEIQQARWTGLARFNQYKYSHYLSMDNEDSEINMVAQINGEANLEPLRQPITIPEMRVPIVNIRTPALEHFSLWDDTILSDFLLTTQQTLDMSSKLTYKKNPEVITVDINVDPLIKIMNANVGNMLFVKDQSVAMLASTYKKAKAEYENYSVDLPKTFTVPAYKVPVMNIEVTSFTIPLPDFTLITMPAFHVPSALSKLTLPKITLPKHITLPLMGELIYEGSMKTAIITLKSDASILNQDNVLVKLDFVSTSEFEALTGKIQGDISLNTAEEFKVASLLSVTYPLVEGSHEGVLVVSDGYMYTTVTNSGKVNLSDRTMEITQALTANADEGLVVSMSTPTFGFLAVQMLPKSPAQVKARLYGRYPSEPLADIDIASLKMSVMNSEKVNIQTTWNMEMPYEMMLGLKNQVPVVVDMVYVPAQMTYKEINKKVTSVIDSFDQARAQTRVMVKRAVDHLATVNPSALMTDVTDKAIVLLKNTQMRVEAVLNAVVKFLRETTFHVYGYEERLSGLEIYQELSTFVVNVFEEAVEKVPMYLANLFSSVVDYIRTIEITLPGSNYIMSGNEIINDLSDAMKTIQDRVIVNAKTIGQISLDDIIQKYSDFVKFTVEQSEKFLETVKSQNVEKLSAFVSEVYTDAMNSPVVAEAVIQAREYFRIVMQYLKTVTTKISDVLYVSTDRLVVDFQSLIDTSAKRINAFQNNVVETMKEKSKSVEPYVRVSDRQMDIDIPLPFVNQLN